MEYSETRSFLMDKGLSLKAKGLLCLGLALPEGKGTFKSICENLKEERKSVKTHIDELIQKGYCVKCLERNQKGKLTKRCYYFYDTPY